LGFAFLEGGSYLPAGRQAGTLPLFAALLVVVLFSMGSPVMAALNITKTGNKQEYYLCRWG